MRNIVRLFFKAERINPWTVLGCLLVASVVEGIGFASLVPLLWIVTDPAQAQTSPVIEFTRGSIGRWTEAIESSGTASAAEIAGAREAAVAQFTTAPS